jgi:putative endopeptidase
MIKSIFKKTSTTSFDNMLTPEAINKDFNEYVNGLWENNNKIPGDWSSWNSFTILVEETNDKLKKILEERVKIKDCPVGTMYSLGMDTERLNKESQIPLKKYLDEIDNIESPEQVFTVIGKFHKMGISCFFGFEVDADPKESSMNRLHLYQGGLSLPERDYYLEDKFKDKRDLYKKHLNTVLKYVGESNDDDYSDVFDFELQLAKLHRTSVDKRDSDKRYYKFTLESFKMDMEYNQMYDYSTMWDAYFKETGLSNAENILLDNPKFFRGLTHRISKEYNLSKVKKYLKLKLLGFSSKCLSEEIEEEYFKFYGTVLSGQEEQKPRWKRILGKIDTELGEILGMYYIEENFDKESKQRVLEMISNIEKEMSKSITNSTWMSEQTKERALLKLAKFNKKIGYPDVWTDYSSLHLDPEKSFLENTIAIQEFKYQKEVINQINKKVDPNKWYMNPHSINAYFDSTQNEIVFPAGILQAPFFDKNASDALNYGGIGAVIAHEITHGYDDQGRKSDENGNLNDWWTKSDSEKFTENTDILVKQYNEYLVHGEHVNGKLTLGENLADYGGLLLSYRALVNNNSVSEQDKRDFFISWGNVWKGIMKKDKSLQMLVIDPHSPMKYRVAAVRNLEEFYQAFGIKEDSPIYIPKDKRVSIW